MKLNRTDNSVFAAESAHDAFSGEFDAKSYVLEMHASVSDAGSCHTSKMMIRPMNISRDDVIAAYRGFRDFSYTLGGMVMSAESEESEQAFMLRAAVCGIVPELRLVRDSDDKQLDLIDMATGKSLYAMRKAAFVRRYGKVK